MVSFDRVLPDCVAICEQFPGFVRLRSACAVRDLQGRLRLVVDPDPTQPDLDRVELANQLDQRLGRFFVGPIWSTNDRNRDEARLASVVLGKATGWRPTYDSLIAGSVAATAPWKKLERRLSKQQWLDSDAPRDPPWKAPEPGPPIITFYSFKGGVGRTTALLACAWQLARDGRRVALIDMDLEAPGLGPLLEIRSQRGVADFLVDHIATGSSTLDDMTGRATALGERGDLIDVLPAGNLDLLYLEKLARIDFLASGGAGLAADSPAEQAMEALLNLVRAKLDPDFIFIDSRAGLHDIAGLSLHRLAHVDVLVGRASEQGYRGLDLAVHALCCRKDLTKLQCVLVHSMAPTADTPEANEEEREFRERSHAIFSTHIYGEQGRGTIEVDTPDAPHRPVVLRDNANLRRFTRISSVVRDLGADDYAALLEQIQARCEPEDP